MATKIEEKKDLELDNILGPSDVWPILDQQMYFVGSGKV
jgi:hypothetical protein